jgi:hypothetical protein
MYGRRAHQRILTSVIGAFGLSLGATSLASGQQRQVFQ